VITAVHGRIANPLDHRDVYPPLCTVAFLVVRPSASVRTEQLSIDARLKAAQVYALIALDICNQTPPNAHDRAAD
jgi:hypothetical protein